MHLCCRPRTVTARCQLLYRCHIHPAARLLIDSDSVTPTPGSLATPAAGSRCLPFWFMILRKGLPRRGCGLTGYQLRLLPVLKPDRWVWRTTLQHACPRQVTHANLFAAAHHTPTFNTTGWVGLPGNNGTLRLLVERTPRSARTLQVCSDARLDAPRYATAAGTLRCYALLAGHCYG